MPLNILLACDESESSLRSFQFALELVGQFKAALMVLSVVQFPEPATMVEISALLESGTEHFEKDFVKLRADAAARGVDLQTRIAVGHAAQQIVHHAADAKAGLIVLGQRGKGAVERWLVGSVSKRAIAHAPCSVLVVRWHLCDQTRLR